MAGVAIALDINQQHWAVIQKAMRRLPNILSDTLDEIGQAMVSNTTARFYASRSPDGSSWPPLKTSTKKRRTGSGKNDKPLLDSSNLVKSLTHRVEGSSVIIGTNLIYAATHQFSAKKGGFDTTKRGAPIPWGDIPARPFLGISEDDNAQIQDIIDRSARLAWQS